MILKFKFQKAKWRAKEGGIVRIKDYYQVKIGTKPNGDETSQQWLTWDS